MPKAMQAGAGVLAIALIGLTSWDGIQGYGPGHAPGALSGAWAASFDCKARGLSRAEETICADAQLSRTDEQLARRADAVARRMNYGQYLGLRHWQATSAQQRDQCASDRACIGAHHRAQKALLDRVQDCLDTRYARRSCLRNSLSGDREALRR